MLTRTRSVMHRVDYHDELNSGQWFRYVDEESDAVERRVYIDHAIWCDLGQPDTITAAIEPGDTLN